ncbi:hypothetical protein N7447_007043 [Penicillium robsamsonii]|uniref:uncharacterized protein n=1 Tax=Penicillium robsamsonii TaxID=1792511 RepID=UPI00254811D1|nr:uncharacterized protein N7447_007043 [Penicillium robsamsonii]KAJ5824703.1 hypothetical protein N7447_007043 [Penicillium robsamsonii]
MTGSQAATLFDRTTQGRLPGYMNMTLSNIATNSDGAEIRDTLRFAQSLSVFATALDQEPREDPAIVIFRRLHTEWAKLIPVRHRANPETNPF